MDRGAGLLLQYTTQHVLEAFRPWGESSRLQTQFGEGESSKGRNVYGANRALVKRPAFVQWAKRPDTNGQSSHG